MLHGTFGELHELRREIAPRVLPQQSLPAVSDVTAACTKNNLILEWLDRRVETEWYPSASEFLRQIKKQGLTGGALSQGDQLLTRGNLLQLCNEYDSRYLRRGVGVPASYVVLMGAARKRLIIQ